ncbi:(2,3-dihydroxybenzoyl)adenylate synthase [Photobacterium sp. 2_MG-2023]|uniref:(2,3-dihydroxybenzoyl)adenylate synthase n=1 Tax=Photobacterium sp. 2_MG-2023 TaxID=3062663 RepID=UPI0026E262D5|nr:(2,3-dihydroxybenzoyl)adenylate synthase [Photobacterium sp. 2_MG-2023]MDO6580957.1 (2,3-dihydroxybenzoyl)adenylate synthase [Photobacterium sp. 2_MG-2023]
MSIAFTPWPPALAEQYRRKGYWTDVPMTDILTRHLDERAEHRALMCGERSWTYRQLEQDAERLAASLLRLGVKPGETALVHLPNVAEFYIVFFALMKLGVVPVNALFSHNRHELTAYAEQIRPTLAIVSSRHSLFADGEFAQALSQQVPTLKHWLVDGDAGFGDSLAAAIAAGTQSQSRALNAQADEALRWPDLSASEVAFFQLSGGSTGTPKLIPRTHNDYYYSVRASADICQLDTDTVFLCALPAPHNFTLSSPGALGVFYAGGAVVLAAEPSPMTCFPLIKRHQVTMTSLVPPAVTLWLQAAADDRSALDSLQWLQVGGARLGESLARRIEPELGCRLQQVFGMAEGLVNYTRFDDSEWHVLNTQGRPISDDDEVRIVDEDGQDVPRGIPGALLTRGPYTFRGYYNSPEHNRVAFDQDGFYRSGDVVVMTEDGYLMVVGRDKDQINRGGEKVAAEEIENQLLALPEITQAALVAMPDEVMGEKSCAFIVTTNPKLKTLSIRKHLRTCGIADYKLPDRIEKLDALPMTHVGKIDKKALRQLIANQVQAQSQPQPEKDVLS